MKLIAKTGQNFIYINAKTGQVNNGAHFKMFVTQQLTTVETEGTVIYLPIYMCYLLKEHKIGQMIVDLDITGL